MQDVESGVPTRISGLKIPVKRILGRNPGPMTGPGTNSYLIGDNRLSLLDPGPLDDVQIMNFMKAIGDRKLDYLLITHTHADHSPAALKIQAETGAELVGMPAPDAVSYTHLTLPTNREV